MTGTGAAQTRTGAGRASSRWPKPRRAPRRRMRGANKWQAAPRRWTLAWPARDTRRSGDDRRFLNANRAARESESLRATGKAKRALLIGRGLPTNFRPGARMTAADPRVRSVELLHWLHRYNWHRPHGSLKANTPISRLGLSEDNTSCRWRLRRRRDWPSWWDAHIRVSTKSSRMPLRSIRSSIPSPAAFISW